MELQSGAGNKVDFLGWEPGRYELKAADGKTAVVEVKGIPSQPITGPWELSFLGNRGAPERLTLDKLMSWTEHSAAGVKYYSGTATSRTNIQVPPELLGKNRRLCLDLGNVQVMAHVKLTCGRKADFSFPLPRPMACSPLSASPPPQEEGSGYWLPGERSM